MGRGAWEQERSALQKKGGVQVDSVEDRKAKIRRSGRLAKTHKGGVKKIGVRLSGLRLAEKKKTAGETSCPPEKQGGDHAPIDYPRTNKGGQN